MALDPFTFKQAMAQWATGVSVITTIADNKYHGMTASSFSSLSLDPLLVSVSIGKKQQTHEFIEKGGVFAVNILKSTQLHWGKLFAGMIPDTPDRFDGIAFKTGVTGSPILPHVLGWVDCRLYQSYDGGDHTIFVGEVVNASAENTGEPLLYYHRMWGMFQPMLEAPSLTHIVMFRLHENTPENQKVIKEALLSLKSEIPQILNIEVGTNVITSDRAYDLALMIRFASIDALNTYQVHPAHVAVVNDIIKPRVASIVAIDYHD